MIWILALIPLLQNAAGQTTANADLPLYPYGTAAGDEKLHRGSVVITMGYNVNFYGRKYNTTYVNRNGILGFGRNVPYERFIFKDGVRDPDRDFPFIAPYYYDGERITSDYQGKIYYRLVYANTSQDLLTHLQYYMINATVGVKRFIPDMALVVTSENVIDGFSVDKGPCTGTISNPCKSATFQLVLVASPMNTFVIFNYKKMEIPQQQYYQAGINGGHGVGWTSVCKQCTLANLPNERGSDVTGRFIFRVSEDTIERGGCTGNGDYLQILPDIVGMFGGELLDISGPCLSSFAAIVCKFGTDPDTVTSDGFMVNSMRAKCPVPKLTERGSVTVALSVNGGNTFRAQGNIYVVMENQVNKSLVFGAGWHQINPDRLDMTWDPKIVSSDPSVKVDIRLIGYREDEVQTYWKTLTTLVSDADNTGSYSFNPADVQCHPADCSLFEVGVVEVVLQKPYHPLANSRTRMVGGVLLGWYVNRAMANQHGDNWPPALCTQWYNKDKMNMNWMNSLLYCPCNVGQAMADFGRWQPDHDCSMFSKSTSNCHYHKGAKHCVRSFEPTSTGAGNQCCYSEDGLLLYAADTYQGSTPDISHDWGAQPYNSPGRVPSLSHWIQDVVSFYYCCLWTGYAQCDYYMEQRPTRDCAGYQLPQAAFAYGDPHIRTFDGQVFNFGGKGDYYLVKTDNFQLQGKFDIGPQIHVNKQFFNATVLSAVAMTVTGVFGRLSVTVEIRLAPNNLNSGRKLDVFVDKSIKLFDSPAVFTQDYGKGKGGISVVNVAAETNINRHDNFTVILASGVGVQVAATNSLLHVIVNVPPTFKNKTSGLLGTWSGTVEDDFTSVNGIVIPITSSPQDVYQKFAKTWRVPEVDSLFAHPEPADDLFVPLFTTPTIAPGSSFSMIEVKYTCGDDVQCRFDYIATGNRDIAEASKKAESWFTELKTFQQPADSCGLLDVRHADKDNFNYSVGNVVTITGCRNGGTLGGGTTYTCTKSSPGVLAWSPSVSAACSASLPTGGPTAPSAGFAERHDLDCSAGVMHIHLPLSLFPTHSVTLRDPTCKVTSNGTHLVTDIGLNQCGTTVTFTNDSVIFNNDLLATASNNPGATVATIIDFGLNSADQRVPVSCIFPRESRLDFGYIPLQRTAHFYEKQYGHLDFEVRHYQTEQYRTLVPNTGLPVGVPLNTEVFIDLFVDQTNHKGVGIFVDSCIATPTTNPADPLWYPLVKDGCPMQADVRTFTTPDVNEFRFSFLAFKFTRAPLQKPAPSLPPSPMVYLHCQVSACPSGNCSTSCHSPSTRTRRSADQQKSHLISTGPFYLKTDDHDQEGYSTAVVVATMSVAAVATLVAMVAIVAWRRSANKLSKYRASTMDVTS